MTFNTIDFQILGLPSYLFVALSGGVITICLYIVLMFSKEYDISQSMKILFFSLSVKGFLLLFSAAEISFKA